MPTIKFGVELYLTYCITRDRKIGYSLLLEFSAEYAEVNNASTRQIFPNFTAAPLFVSGEFPNKLCRVKALDIREWFWFFKQSSRKEKDLRIKHLKTKQGLTKFLPVVSSFWSKSILDNGM